jgi:hypothetical protein
MAVPLWRHAHWSKNDRVTVTIEGRAQDLGKRNREFRVAATIRVSKRRTQSQRLSDEGGTEIPIAVRSLERGGRAGAKVRSDRLLSSVQG